VESGIHCIFILLRRTTIFQQILDSTGIWPIPVESSGIGMRHEANAFYVLLEKDAMIYDDLAQNMTF
jgi:hypothetical protein